MRMYECENCHSVFVVNEADPRVRSGEYSFFPGEDIHCLLCCKKMIRFDREEEKEEGDAVSG